MVRMLHCTVGDAFTEHGVVGKIFVAKKIFVTPSVLRLQKWFLHQNGVEFNHKFKSGVCIVWLLARRESKDAHLAEINYDPLVAHSALESGVLERDTDQ